MFFHPSKEIRECVCVCVKAQTHKYWHLWNSESCRRRPSHGKKQNLLFRIQVQGTVDQGHFSPFLQWAAFPFLLSSVQFSLVAQPCPNLHDPMDCSMPGFPVHHQLPELAQTHVHWVSGAIQPSHPLLSHSPPALNLSQHQGLFQWVSSLHQVAKILELQLEHQSFQWIFRVDFL